MAGKILHDLAGQRFTDWTVLCRTASPPGIVSRTTYWLCRCVCGHERAVRSSALLIGRSTGCGCGKSKRLSQRMKTHGRSNCDLYHIWQYIIQRCTNPKNTGYRRYGGRGIKVCDRWLESFENFLADVGERPSPKHSLDRIDNDKGYESGNCRWATRYQQHRNRATNRFVEVGGRRMCVADLQYLCGTNGSAIIALLKRGVTADEIVERYRAEVWMRAACHPCA